MNSLCNKCSHQFSCCLNYDGKPCKETRDIEPNNADYFRDLISNMDDNDLSLFIVDCIKRDNGNLFEFIDPNKKYNELVSDVYKLLTKNRKEYIKEKYGE